MLMRNTVASSSGRSSAPTGTPNAPPIRKGVACASRAWVLTLDREVICPSGEVMTTVGASTCGSMIQASSEVVTKAKANPDRP